MGSWRSWQAAAAWKLLLLLLVRLLLHPSDCKASAQLTSRRRNTEIALLMSTRTDDEVELRGDGRHSYVSCRGDPGICRDPERNPGGGSTCCWNRICKDTENDINHCGRCGRPCGFGLHCCGGTCVNLLWDNFNCGCCGIRCPCPSQCAFGMCGYAGSSSS